jgi:enoyl-CoA hydratase/carnithine racemase
MPTLNRPERSNAMGRELLGEALAQAPCVGLDDAREGITAWLEKREPKFKGR